MTRFVVPLIVGLCSVSLAGATQVGPVLTDKSKLVFVSKQMGVPVDGEFRKFAVQMNFDPAKPEAGKARIEIDMASIDAGSSEANEEVAGKNWFNVKQFPKANFVSSEVRPLGANKFEVAGKLTIRDRTREVRAPVTITTQGGIVRFDGSFDIKRADFGIGQGAWADFDTVANEVQIKFAFVAQAAK